MVQTQDWSPPWGSLVEALQSHVVMGRYWGHLFPQPVNLLWLPKRVGWHCWSKGMPDVPLRVWARSKDDAKNDYMQNEERLWPAGGEKIHQTFDHKTGNTFLITVKMSDISLRVDDLIRYLFLQPLTLRPMLQLYFPVFLSLLVIFVLESLCPPVYYLSFSPLWTLLVLWFPSHPWLLSTSSPPNPWKAFFVFFPSDFDSQSLYVSVPMSWISFSFAKQWPAHWRPSVSWSDRGHRHRRSQLC